MGGLEACEWLDKAPSRHGARLDLTRLNERVVANNALGVVERLHYGHPLVEREHDLVRQHQHK